MRIIEINRDWGDEEDASADTNSLFPGFDKRVNSQYLLAAQFRRVFMYDATCPKARPKDHLPKRLMGSSRANHCLFSILVI